MNTLKPFVILAVLGGLGYLVYTRMNSGAEGPPPGAENAWAGVPNIELPGDTAAAAAPAGASPSFLGGASAPWNNAGAAQASATTAPASGAAPAWAGSAPPSTDNAAAAPAWSAGTPAAPPAGAGDPSMATGGSYAAAPASYGSATGAPAGDANLGPGAAPGEFATAIRQVRGELDRGANMAQCLKALTQWYDRPGLSVAEQQELVDLLGQLAGTVIYSTEEHLGPLYEVQPGETLQQVAAKFNLSPELLMKINGLPDMAAAPGTRLKVIQGQFNASINLQTRQLALIVDGMYAGRFEIGLGADSPPREGQFNVVEKVRNPIFHGTGRVVPGDDPQNPLGGYLIRLDDNMTIHGRAVGSAPDDRTGCIQVGQPGIDDVFDILSIGSRVTIHR